MKSQRKVRLPEKEWSSYESTKPSLFFSVYWFSVNLISSVTDSDSFYQLSKDCIYKKTDDITKT